MSVEANAQLSPEEDAQANGAIPSQRTAAGEPVDSVVEDSPAAAGKSKRKAKKTKDSSEEQVTLREMLSTVTTIFTYVGVGAVILGCILSFAGVWRLGTILSGSMRPVFQPGSMIYAFPQAADTLSPGAIIVFNPPKGYSDVEVTHRVTSVEKKDDGHLYLTTKGDANNAADPWGEVMVTTKDVWVVKGNIPLIGWVANWSQRGWPLLLSIMLAAPFLRYANGQVWRTDENTGRKEVEA